MTDVIWHVYKKQIAFIYGDVGEAIVADVESGNHTPAEALELIARAERRASCSECGRDCDHD
jgi:hypothetical protein